MSRYYPRDGHQGSNFNMRLLGRHNAPVSGSAVHADPPANSRHSLFVQGILDEWVNGPQIPNQRITTPENDVYLILPSHCDEIDDTKFNHSSTRFLKILGCTVRGPSPILTSFPGNRYDQFTSYHSEGDPRLIKRYATNLILICLWAIILAVLVGLLEGTAHHARMVVKQPWYYDWLPTIALTVLAQLHGPITAAFDARIAVSTLGTRWAPKTWAELFYTADGQWGSPIGMLSSLWNASFKLSLVFYVFMLHTILAFIAPLLLARAYPFRMITVVQNTSLPLNTFDPPSMSLVELRLQLAVGSGSLETGLSILDIYGSSAYVPIGSSRDSTPSEMFFAGDSQQTDTLLDGLHIKGGCERVQGLADPISEDAFKAMCETLTVPDDDGSPMWANELHEEWNETNITTISCTSKPPLNLNWWDNSSSITSSATGYMWILATNYTNTVSGVAMCNATFTTGQAQVYGREGTFEALQPAAIYNKALQGEPLANPLTAAMIALGNPTLNSTYALSSPVAVFRMWGYTSTFDASYDQPTIDAMIGQIWAGTLFMTSSIAILSQKTRVRDVVAYASVSGRVKEELWAEGAIAFLVLWLALIVLLAMGLFRPAIGDWMNSYVAARLMAEHPELVRGNRYGTLKDNKNMRRAFSSSTDGV
ncbi:hypothetical protein HWV62_21268 [Athelia sp. TMB]|nr:hypothetical protein HWV62_21268 [Athelia sp. TMB]